MFNYHIFVLGSNSPHGFMLSCRFGTSQPCRYKFTWQQQLVVCKQYLCTYLTEISNTACIESPGISIKRTSKSSHFYRTPTPCRPNQCDPTNYQALPTKSNNKVDYWPHIPSESKDNQTLQTIIVPPRLLRKSYHTLSTQNKSQERFGTWKCWHYRPWGTTTCVPHYVLLKE